MEQLPAWNNESEYKALNSPDFKQDMTLVRSLIADIQRSRISVNGLIVLIKGHPTLIVLKWNDFKIDPRNAIALTAQ